MPDSLQEPLESRIPRGADLLVEHDDRGKFAPQRVRPVVLESLLCLERLIIVPRDGRAWEEDRPLLYRAELVEVAAEEDDGNPAEVTPTPPKPAELLVDDVQRPRTEEEALMMLGHGDDGDMPVPATFMFVPGMPVVVNRNTHQGQKLVNGASYTAVDVILDKAYPGHRISAEMALHFGPPAGIVLASKTTAEFHFVGMPAGTILLTPMSTKIECQRKRPWQKHTVSRRGLPCTAAFACTDYKVQSRTLDRVALELRGTRTTKVDGDTVPSPCDPYSLYVQLSRCRTLHGVTLLSKARVRHFVGNRVPHDMVAAEARLEELSIATIRDAEGRGALIHW